jgi:hypothetical protein
MSLACVIGAGARTVIPNRFTVTSPTLFGLCVDITADKPVLREREAP